MKTVMIQNGKNSGSFWDTIKPLMSDKNHQGSSIILMENSTVVTNKTKVCNIFNEYFVNIADSLGEPEKINLTEPLENVQCI